MTATIELETARLRLRRFRATDVDDALEYRNDPAFARFLPHIPHPFTREDAQRFVALNMSEDWTTSPTFAVTLEDKLIGTVNFELDLRIKTAMLGYAMGRAWWGQGLATEAATAALHWVRQEHRLERIWASADVRNEKSRRVLERLGFARESVRRALHPGRDGEAVDEVVYGLECRP